MRGERNAGRHILWRLLTAMALVVVIPGATPAGAEPGVSETEVLLGMSNALSGPAAALGTGVRKGALVYFNKVNGAGGVHGRSIKVVSYDDGYEPKVTFANTEKLINGDRVFALFGYVGTPTSKAILPLVNREKIIFFAPFTGAEFLRKPVNRHIFNVRGSYFDEAAAQVDYLTATRNMTKIGMFLQNDAYGLAVKGGVLKALKAKGLAMAGEGTYERNTEAVAAGLAELKKGNPEAVSMVGTYKAMAAFIRKAKAERFNPVFLNVSFVGTAALGQELGPAGEGVLISQVMPSPHDPSLPIVAQYQADMKAAGHSRLDYTDLEGYIDAAVFTEVLKKAGKNLTREAFIAAAEGLRLTLGGLQFAYAPDNHQALGRVYMTRLSGGKAVPAK